MKTIKKLTIKNYFHILMILICTLLTITSCKSYKAKLIPTGGNNDAIKNAIIDFSNTNQIYRKNRVFSVNVYDTLYRLVLVKSKDNYSYKRGKFYEGITAVTFIPLLSGDKLLLTSEAKVGSKVSKLPSRFIEIDERLFYWWDKDYPLTQDALDIYSKYNLLQDDEGGVIQLPDFTIDDSQKGVDYYFCKNNLLNFKKVTTKTGIGFYDMPKLNCN
ncbi:MAG: hypothetical protein COZ75_06690 [Flavobacteriaceae bacterium CG_4_8_14_3_um_filter_34_10]|nr:hypothetical protein [Flavobacteriia bacterium]PIV49564.1 MAG: hypothetical protein COS19_07965 [Flavobacteriaceae bacterium CG02_land_8_20_14_3_00_34_13]PIX09451.1 MAG: hypothetical protein COZ75_06690 [Flavobacteriaceae bacterium CG_4_8_14_3_um_filter_34_10]PJC08011.1 MAG: hypothetical protein CO068_03180 [Flavobacteriaceae bacterium CG_4_9_14_0_8_um_filter_34_30]